MMLLFSIKIGAYYLLGTQSSFYNLLLLFYTAATFSSG